MTISYQFGDAGAHGADIRAETAPTAARDEQTVRAAHSNVTNSASAVGSSWAELQLSTMATAR